jgi:hypothetical protein
MKKWMRLVLLAVLALVVAVGVSACDEEDHSKEEEEAAAVAKSYHAYIPANGVEFHNYNSAQELYDNPATILWCTAFPQSPTQKPITVPVAGKLTSSTTTFFKPEERVSGEHGAVALPRRSVDGLYHPNPPQYRYGFTPGGQYIDFFDMPTVCTTQPLEYQAESVALSVDGSLLKATHEAEASLESGDKAGAQKALSQAAAGSE